MEQNEFKKISKYCLHILILILSLIYIDTLTIKRHLRNLFLLLLIDAIFLKEIYEKKFPLYLAHANKTKL
jgi:hypothetical protein